MNRILIHVPRFSWLAFAVAVALPAAARSQEPVLWSEAAEVVASARANGLPAGPIVAKIYQGVQLQRSRETILVVARAEAGRLAEAQKALGAAAPEPDLRAGAEALGQGVPLRSLSEVRRARQSGSVAVALGILTQLVVEDLPVARATEVVVGLLRRGVSDAQILAFGDTLAKDRKAGMSMESALSLRLGFLYATLPSVAADGPAFGQEALTTGPRTGIPTSIADPTKPPIIRRPP